MFRRLRAKLGAKINETDAAKSFYESEEYKELKQFRKEAKEFKGDLKEQIDTTQNPTV